VLEQLCAPLCNAVLEQTGSQAMLEHLEAANLFVQRVNGEPER
jgi:ATP/maltotriose-dependent transcriptional regulator MalT